MPPRLSLGDLRWSPAVLFSNPGMFNLISLPLSLPLSTEEQKNVTGEEEDGRIL